MDTQVKPQRKAVVPTRAIVWALEQGAEGTPPENRVPELTKAVDRYIMAMARFNLACSARFNDVQHTSPQTVKSTSNTLELLAWQTKTTPLFSFSGARWWIPLERWWKRFRASEEFREMDYLIPTINKDRTGFIPRPGTPDRSLRWLKDAFQSRTWLNSHGTPSGSSCRIGHSRRTYRGTSAETGSRSPRRMSTPGRSDTWCAPSGTRSSRSSRPCNSRQEGRSESTSDMRTERTRWSARPHRRPCSRKSRTHRPRMPAGM